MQGSLDRACQKNGGGGGDGGGNLEERQRGGRQRTMHAFVYCVQASQRDKKATEAAAPEAAHCPQFQESPPVDIIGDCCCCSCLLSISACIGLI